MKYIKLFQDDAERIPFETNEYEEPYVSLTLDHKEYSATIGGGVAEATPNGDGTFTVKQGDYLAVTVSSQNTFIYFLDNPSYTELPSASATDGQNATFEISGTTYYGKWFSERAMYGWELYETSDYSGDFVGGVLRVVIIVEESELLHYNQRKLATLTLNDGSTVIIGGWFDRDYLMKEDIDPYRETVVSAVIENGTKSIGFYTFIDCTNLTSVTVDENAQIIYFGGFSGCTSLTSIDIPNGVESIYASTFKGCTSLTSITIPNTVTSVDVSAFNDTPWWNTYSADTNNQYGNIIYINDIAVKAVATSITSCEFKEGTVRINMQCLKDCNKLTSVVIPDSVTSIGYNAFYGCSGLTSVTIPDGVTSIESSTFANCKGLTNISIPNSVTTIGTMAFDNCSGLTSIEIPNSVTGIYNSAFGSCTSLTTINIPNSVTRIDYHVFNGCTGLESITIGSGLTDIDGSAFGKCTNLTSIVVDSNNATFDSRNNCNAIIEKKTNTLIAGCKSTVIPNSVTTIRSNAFYGCNGLKSIELPNSITNIGNFAFDECTSLTTINIPNSVITIDNGAFSMCRGLTSVTLGSGLATIGNQVFYYCTALNSIITLAATAPTIQNETFHNVKSKGTLTVPSGSTGYDVWMGTGNYYLGKYNWTKVEQ